jgi:hypothetical protein
MTIDYSLHAPNSLSSFKGRPIRDDLRLWKNAHTIAPSASPAVMSWLNRLAIGVVSIGHPSGTRPRFKAAERQCAVPLPARPLEWRGRVCGVVRTTGVPCAYRGRTTLVPSGNWVACRSGRIAPLPRMHRSSREMTRLPRWSGERGGGLPGRTAGKSSHLRN